MRLKNIARAAGYMWLLFCIGISGEIRWPGEKKFQGMHTLEEVRAVFLRDTSAYDRRYLIQAVPFFIEKNGIPYVQDNERNRDANTPDWLAKEIGSAIESNDFNLVYEGIIAAQRLKLSVLSESMVKAYKKARTLSPGEMPKIHVSSVGALVDFNTENSRQALSAIVSNPLPAKIVQDIVPALKGLYQVGDIACLGALNTLSTRLQGINDSLSAGLGRAMVSQKATDSLQIKKINGILAGAAKVRQKVQERAGVK
jgi:hypothetical protein